MARLPVAVPGPDRDLPDRVKLVVGNGVRVLHGDLRPELDVLAYRVAERPVFWHAHGVQRGHVELDEPLALLFGDLQVPVDVDQVPRSRVRG